VRALIAGEDDALLVRADKAANARGAAWILGPAATERSVLDGIASGGMICERLAPSMKIQGLSGMFQSRDEASYVMERLRTVVERSMQYEPVLDRKGKHVEVASVVVEFVNTSIANSRYGL